MQHHDPHVIGEILKQVESGQLFRHLDKDKHAEMMLEAEKSVGRDEKDILKDFGRDLPILEKMMGDPDRVVDDLRRLADGDPTNC